MTPPPGTTRAVSLSRAQRVGLALGPALFLAAELALRATSLPAPARRTAGTVLLMATFWITEPIPLAATALLPLLLFPLVGGGGFVEVLLQYFDPVIFLFLGGMWIAAAMEQWGLHRRIALGIIARIGTSPRRIVLGFMLATGFVSLWISNTAAALMMVPIGVAVLAKLEEQLGPEDPLLRRCGRALMLGIAYAASLGGMGSKIGTGTNLVFVKLSSGVLEKEVSFLDWFKVGLPAVALLIPAAWLYLVRVAARLPPDELPGGREVILEARRRLPRWHAGEAVALVAFLLAGGLWTFRQEMDFGAFRVPGWAAGLPSAAELLGGRLGALPRPLAELLGPRGAESLIALVIGGSLLLVPVGRRPPRMALSLRSASRISWGLLVLLGGGFAMAHGVQASGLSDGIASALQGARTGSPFLALLLFCWATVALSEIASNTATASILLPLLAASAANFGLHPAVLMFAVTLSASLGFMLPAGTPPNAVAFSSGYLRVPEMARSGLAVDIGGAVIIAALCHYVAPMAFGLGR